MAIEEYEMLAAAVGVATLIGFILGKLSGNANKNRSSTQRITQNEMQRWKINSKYADILTGKAPVASATRELGDLDKLKEQNLAEIDLIESKLGDYIDKLELIRKEANALKAPIQVAAKREVSVSLWSSMYTELRQDVQDCNAMNVRHGYSKRLLRFIINGNVKPGLIELMDGEIIDDEILTAGLKKNLKLSEAVMKGMTSESDEFLDNMMGFNR